MIQVNGGSCGHVVLVISSRCDSEAPLARVNRFDVKRETLPFVDNPRLKAPPPFGSRKSLPNGAWLKRQRQTLKNKVQDKISYSTVPSSTALYGTINAMI
jgi:hypothetical protein